MLCLARDLLNFINSCLIFNIGRDSTLKFQFLGIAEETWEDLASLTWHSLLAKVTGSWVAAAAFGWSRAPWFASFPTFLYCLTLGQFTYLCHWPCPSWPFAVSPTDLMPAMLMVGSDGICSPLQPPRSAAKSPWRRAGMGQWEHLQGIWVFPWDQQCGDSRTSSRALLYSPRHSPRQEALGIAPWVYGVGVKPQPASSLGKWSGIKEVGTSQAALAPRSWILLKLSNFPVQFHMP